MTQVIQESANREVTPVDAGEITGCPALLREVLAHRKAGFRAREHYLRHGYSCRSALRLPDGPAIRSTWRGAPLP